MTCPNCKASRWEHSEWQWQHCNPVSCAADECGFEDKLPPLPWIMPKLTDQDMEEVWAKVNSIPMAILPYQPRIEISAYYPLWGQIPPKTSR